MHKLYVDSNGKKAIVEGKVARRDEPYDSVTLMREVDEDGDLCELRFMPSEEFERRYDPVSWDCGVDLYAILHCVLDRARAWEAAEKIDAALAAVAEKKAADPSD